MANVAPLRGAMLVTVTAPGVDAGMAWDTSACSHGPEERCSGSRGCKTHPIPRDRWHRDHEARWTKLNRAAAMRARRLHGRGPLIAAKTWEMQKRGLAHLHVVVPYWTPAERKRGDAYVQALQDLAPRHWFGNVDASRTWGGENGGARAAGYCVKYIGKDVGETVVARRPAYVGQYLTRETRMTMRNARLRRHVWHVLQTAECGWEDIDADPHDPTSWLHMVGMKLANPPPISQARWT